MGFMANLYRNRKYLIFNDIHIYHYQTYMSLRIENGKQPNFMDGLGFLRKYTKK